MAKKNTDGSVTLTAQEFRCCAALMELPADEFFAFLNEAENGVTAERLVEKIMQYHQTANCAVNGLAN